MLLSGTIKKKPSATKQNKGLPTVAVLTALIIGFGASSLLAQEDTSRETLSYQREMFKTYKHVEFDLGGEPSRFAWRETPALFPHSTISHHQTRPLEAAPNQAISTWQITYDGQAMTFDDYVSMDDHIDSVMVLKDGKITYQRYKTMGPLDRHYAWSVTKVLTAAALARLEAMGEVNMQDPVKTYLPQLDGSIWGDRILQDVIDMASGIDCRDGDGYQNTEACVYRAEESLGIVPQVRKDVPPLMELLTTMRAHRMPGEETEYTSSNTNVAGFIIEAVTNKPLSKALSELIWQPMGAEADALMTVNKYGEAYASGGLNARLSDVARFGSIFLDNNGAWLTMPESHRRFLKDAHRPIYSERAKDNYAQLFDGDAPLHSRWQWDMIWADGDMFKGGYSGQGVYVSPKNNMVVAWFGTDDKQFGSHQLLKLARKLSTSDVVQ